MLARWAPRLQFGAPLARIQLDLLGSVVYTVFVFGRWDVCSSVFRCFVLCEFEAQWPNLSYVIIPIASTSTSTSFFVLSREFCRKDSQSTGAVRACLYITLWVFGYKWSSQAIFFWKHQHALINHKIFSITNKINIFITKSLRNSICNQMLRVWCMGWKGLHMSFHKCPSWETSGKEVLGAWGCIKEHDFRQHLQ